MYKITTLVHNCALLLLLKGLEKCSVLSVGKRNTEIWIKRIDDIVHITTAGLKNGRL